MIFGRVQSENWHVLKLASPSVVGILYSGLQTLHNHHSRNSNRTHYQNRQILGCVQILPKRFFLLRTK
nr:MAG TPA: hypothetical protein [Caudoviricetes sp.]